MKQQPDETMILSNQVMLHEPMAPTLGVRPFRPALSFAEEQSTVTFNAGCLGIHAPLAVLG